MAPAISWPKNCMDSFNPWKSNRSGIYGSHNARSSRWSGPTLPFKGVLLILLRHGLTLHGSETVMTGSHWDRM
jgi:hypothetical protein